MKDFIKFMSRFTGIFRSIVTILFLLAIVFTGLVNKDLILAFVDMLGFSGLSVALIKPILFVIFGLMFIINFVITRHIFVAGTSGRYHGSNLVFALLFLVLNVFVYISLRKLDNIVSYIFFAFNGLIAINSILGLVARNKGAYQPEITEAPESQVKTSFIEFDDEDFEATADSAEEASSQIQITENDLIIEEPTSEIILEEEAEQDVEEIEKDQEKVFESDNTSTSAEEVNANTDTSQRPKTINRVAKKKSEDRASQNLPASDATNKIERSDKISQEELYQLPSDEGTGQSDSAEK